MEIKLRKIRPAEGTCRWLRLPDPQMGLLEINGKKYALTILPGCVRLMQTNGVMYDVNTEVDPWMCDCPDYQYARAGVDPMGCKHVRAIKAALSSAGITLPPRATLLENTEPSSLPF